MIDDYGTKVTQDPGHIQFINSIDGYQYEKVMSCNNIDNNIVQEGENKIVWELKGIIAYEETLTIYHPNYKGVWCNVTVGWKIGEDIIDCLSIIKLDDPFIFDLYTNENNLLLKITPPLILIFIGITLNQPLIKYGKTLIYASLQRSKHQDFGSFHESKHQEFGNHN